MKVTEKTSMDAQASCRGSLVQPSVIVRAAGPTADRSRFGDDVLDMPRVQQAIDV
jgi:hypothetical protein